MVYYYVDPLLRFEEGTMKRRDFLKYTAALAAIPALPQGAMASVFEGIVDNKAPDNEAYWATVRAQYDITNEVTNLEAGYWGIMPRPTTEAFFDNMRFINSHNTIYARGDYGAVHEDIVARLAAKLGVGTDELVLTRNATERLRALITGYNKLKPGDTVLYANTDYGSMQTSMRYLEKLRGVKVVEIKMPEPASHQQAIDSYVQAIKAHPTTKLILITHLSNRTGMITPAKEVTAIARQRGVDVILDAAHSWGQFDFNFQDLGVDFVGFNLHKWIAAPLGVGMMYIRKNRILDIDPQHMEASADNADIQHRVHPGTMNFASVLTVPAALNYQENIGIEHIGRRLSHLRDTWVSGVKDNPKVEVLTVDDPRMYAGITSFRIKHITSNKDNAALVQTLKNDYGVFTVNIDGLLHGGAIRVSPALYNSTADAEKLAAAINRLTG